MIGTRLGPYEVTSPLGAGGMGEVYRAHDVRLRRDVAVKVLPASVAGDADRLRRFEQEALATAALNHPNILAVFDVGREGETAYVVAELLEGQTLREALTSAAIAPRKAIDYGVQIAHGLAAAHERGIVHRDLKPENLFITTDERVKILDFGLARIAGAPSGGASTVLAPATEPGMVLGTIGYMAPEQVRATTVDHRADIFSFGAVLYEMLTGRRAFGGDTAADVMTAILKDAPPALEESGRAVPPALARVVDRCLEKNPARRFQSASDLAFALQTLGSDARSGSAIAPAATPTGTVTAAPRNHARASILVTLGLLASALTGAGIWSWLAPAPAVPAFLTMDIAAPPGHTLGPTSALSPDGSQLAFEAEDAAQRGRLWLRTLATGEARPLDGTEDGDNPFWSPDGQSLGFFANRRLLTIDLQSGRVRVVCDADGVRVAGAWSTGGVILFSREAGLPLMRVAARQPGAPVVLAHAVGVRPKFLPDGRHFLFTTGLDLSDVGVASRGIRVGDLESDETVEIARGRDATYAAGHLLRVQANSLTAQPFDPSTRQPSGEPRVLVEDVGRYAGDTGSTYSVAGNLVAYRRVPEFNRRLAFYARDGTSLGTVEGGGSWRNPVLSPDDTQVAAQRDDQQGLRQDVWLYDLSTRTARGLFATPDSEYTPVWSADGSRVVVKSIASGRSDVAAGTTRLLEKVVETGEQTVRMSRAFTPGMTVQELTPDGRGVISFAMDAAGNRDIVLTPFDPDQPETVFAKTPANENQPTISPDGRWLAYVSDDLGTRQIFIQPFPSGGRRIDVTQGGEGVQPRWRRDGRELFFLSGDGVLMAVSIDGTGDTLRPGSPRRLFETTIDVQAGLGTRADYDVTRDGQRFVVAEPREADAGGAITVFVNWMAGLRARPGAPER